MRTADMIQSKYIRKEVLKTGPLVLTIAACTLEKFGGGGRSGQADQKWVLWFSDHDKGLTLNTTKIRDLEAAYGDDSDRWVGKRVKLSFDPTVRMGADIVGGIILTCSTGAPGAGPAAPPGAPPPPVWDPATQQWIVQPAAPPVTPPPPVWNAQTQQWEFRAAAPPPPPPSQPPAGPPPTMSQRVNAGAPEFDDDIPF